MPAPPACLSRDWGARRTFDYQGIKINYYEAGQGPPVLLLHGFGGCAYTWRYLIPPLAEAHRVLTLELKGFGLSDKPRDGHYAVADQAQIVAAFIRRQDLRNLVIMGHSMGGGVALMTYLGLQKDDPGRINKLVLIDSAGYPQKLPSFISLARIPGADILGALVPPRFAAALVLKKCYYYKDQDHPGTDRHLCLLRQSAGGPGGHHPDGQTIDPADKISTPHRTVQGHQGAGPDHLGGGRRGGAAEGRP